MSGYTGVGANTRFENIGNRAVAFIVVDRNGQNLGKVDLSSNGAKILPFYGEGSRALLDNGHGVVRAVQLQSGGAYQIYWDGDGWNIRAYVRT